MPWRDDVRALGAASWRRFVVGYLLGSIPFGLILTRLAGLGDIRAIGSGNIGATNVLRTGRKDLAAATLLVDVPEGHGRRSSSAGHVRPVPALVAGLGAFLGHLFPVWLGFKGGKGVATYLGVACSASHWPAALVFAVVWLGASRSSPAISSLGALAASLVTPLALFFFSGRSERPACSSCSTVHPVAGATPTTSAASLAGTEGRIGSGDERPDRAARRSASPTTSASPGSA